LGRNEEERGVGRGGVRKRVLSYQLSVSREEEAGERLRAESQKFKAGAEFFDHRGAEN